MSWHYSQEQGEGFSLESYLDGLRSARSRSSSTLERSSSLGSGTGSSQSSRSGTTSRRSTGDRGEGSSTSFLEGSPVRTSQRREGAQASTESGLDSGDTWRGSFAKYDPDTSSWRTHQCSLLGGFIEFSETWPRWGSMRNGECWERVTLARLTEGIESGSLRQMTTPTANKWPTPAAHIAIEGGYPAERRRNEHTLTAQAIDRPRWPTPQASDWKLRYPTKNWKGEDLVSTVNQREGRKPKNWPTPQASDNRDRGCLSTPAVKRRQKKGKQISLSMSASDKCGRLNPHWVAWLMGWPMGWTEASPIDPLVMEDWRRKTEDGTWWLGEPEGVPRVDGSNENRTPRLKALGNGQVPLCAAMAWELLTRRLT